MAGSSPPGGQTFAQQLFSGAARGYDGIAQALSFGQYRRWHHMLAHAAKQHGLGPRSRVLDVATGTGLIARDLEHATGCHVVGLDLTRRMMERGRKRPTSGPDTRGALVQADATRLPLRDETVDGLTFSYLYRYVDDLQATTRELVRVVRPGGFVGMIEFHIPPHPVFRTLWHLHSRIGLPVAGTLMGAGWGRVGRFLGPSIERFYDAHAVADLLHLWHEAGLVDIVARTPSLGGALLLTARKEAPP